jgi:hypothetical protein
MDELNISKDVEIQRCSEDFIYFCENYVKINNPAHGLVNFILHPYQKRYVEALQTNRYLICKKFRQGGFTTLSIAWSLWKCIFSFDQRIIFMSKTDREATYYGGFAKLMIEELPDWLKPKMDINNDHQKSFSDMSSNILFSTPKQIRGHNANYLFIEEAAFFLNMNDHWKLMWTMLGAGGHCIICSSTNGTGNWFHKTYTEAEQLKNEFKIFHCSYLDHPDYTDEWAANMKQNLGAKGWRQEIMCEFLSPDTRTSQERMSDTIQFFEDTSAAEEFVESLNKNTDPKKLKIKLENWKTKKDVKDGLDWSFETSYTDNPKPSKKEEPEYKPQAYQFRNMSREEQKAFVTSYESIHTVPVGHPEFDKLEIKNADDLADLWSDVSELYPEYSEIKDFWVKASEETHAKMIEIEDRINESVFSDMLVMAGVVSKQEADTLPVYQKFARPDLKIIDTIKASKRYPDNLILSFSQGKLCINQVPTVIMEDDVKDLYNGIFSLIGYEQAIKSTVDAITSKLDDLFMEKNNEESLDEKALK